MEEKDRLEVLGADIKKELSELKKEKRLLEDWIEEGKKEKGIGKLELDYMKKR